MTETHPSQPALASRRSLDEHERRLQILDVADSHFRKFGFEKTTMADLAKKIGFSTTYIYKFFVSKQAIGEAICRNTFGKIAEELALIAREKKPAATRLRLVYQTTARRGAEICFKDHKLHDLAVTACVGNWRSIPEHQAMLLDIIRGLIAEGRELGEFERKTPIEETSLAILRTLELFSYPVFLERHIDDPEGRATLIADLVLRSLAP